jgi:aminoglycoside phosphotransferase (APT) family kinase protein
VTVTGNTDISSSLLGVLRSATGVQGLEFERRPEPMTGGYWADTYAFSLASPPAGWPAELVARLMPDPLMARRETAVQAAVAAAGYPTPSVRASGGPGDGLGRAFMVMDRAAGGPLLRGLDNGVTPAAAYRLARQVPGVLAGSMARLHALDPDLVRGGLTGAGDLPATVRGFVLLLARQAVGYQRPDLVAAAGWLEDHPPPPAPDVICHGDMHPFNLLADGDQVTVLDWTSAMLAPRAYDVAFTSLLLSEPPVRAPGWRRPLVRAAGQLLARRLIRAYQREARAAITPGELAWHQGVVCLRALVEVASWAHQGVLDERAAHPWLAASPAFAGRLTALTGTPVRPARAKS